MQQWWPTATWGQLHCQLGMCCMSVFLVVHTQQWDNSMRRGNICISCVHSHTPLRLFRRVTELWTILTQTMEPSLASLRTPPPWRSWSTFHYSSMAYNYIQTNVYVLNYRFASWHITREQHLHTFTTQLTPHTANTYSSIYMSPLYLSAGESATITHYVCT